MPALSSDLRKDLETTVVKARDLAERGARDALTALAVPASEPFPTMGEDDRKLRNRLRAHARQLGDQRDAQKGTQGIERLVREMAYEHWHRMLFARFLAENQLLIEPTSGVSVSLDECEELAAEAGTDLWGMAAQFAQAMLPQIFRVDDPVLAAKLPLEIRQQLQSLLAGLEMEVFTASDSLGWTYQFWQTKRKKEVNDSGVKIGADELSPVTQLFTEDYMVDFLLDNTLGAWHAGKVLAAKPQLAGTAKSEEELRQAVSLPGCPWSYLRFIKTEDNHWVPAAGTFEGWPKTAAELKCLDPCMGSGHFVVAMFERLVALRLTEEGLNEAEAVAGVIQDNLFGLEIDPRCTQIAAFNVALAAWRRVGYRSLPGINLACSGLVPNSSISKWLALAGDHERLRNGMNRLYQLFEKASVIGSLINPRADKADLLVADFNELQPLLAKAMDEGSEKGESEEELAVIALGLSKAAQILAEQFDLVATNVPYLGKRKQDEALVKHCAKEFGDSSTDLATIFTERSLQFCRPGGSIALVTLQNWLFLKTYESFRRSLLAQQEWLAIARLGPQAFQTRMWDFNVQLLVMGRPLAKSSVAKSRNQIVGLDVSGSRGAEEKASALESSSLTCIEQSEQVNNPGARITFGEVIDSPRLSDFAWAFQGTMPSDRERLVRTFAEFPVPPHGWRFMQGSSPVVGRFSGLTQVFNFELFENIYKEIGGRLQGMKAWGSRGVCLSIMNQLPRAHYLGDIFDGNVHAIVPKKKDFLGPLMAYCFSEDFVVEVRKLDQKVSVTCGTINQLPFDLGKWQAVAASLFSEGLPRPNSEDPTQWIFDGNPAWSAQPLHVAVARLLGYLWPRQTGSDFLDCSALEPDGLDDLADDDGIVCLSPARGEAAAADRLRCLLAEAFSEEWSSAKERELLLETAVAFDAKKAAADLGDWLRQNFFTEHCKLFQSRPFIWQIWDGNPNGFSALVNYHKLAAPNGQGRKTLELLTYTYLGDWIERQKLDQAEGINGADDRHAAAIDLQNQLKKILDGEPPYDIFVRWKPLHQQVIGWDPDINDGVRLNIRPFLNAQLRKGGKAGAGILRAKPGTIKWAKDRGKEPMRAKDEFPWFWGWDESDHTLATDFGATIPGAPPAGDSFDGNRWNDLHYSRAAKKAARARHRGDS